MRGSSRDAKVNVQRRFERPRQSEQHLEGDPGIVLVEAPEHLIPARVHSLREARGRETKLLHPATCLDREDFLGRKRIDLFLFAQLVEERI